MMKRPAKNRSLLPGQEPCPVRECEDDKHAERIQYPDVPKEEWHPSKRVAAMEANATTDGDKFEVKAAKHDIEAGDIKHGKQLSRNLSAEERAAGVHPDDHKIWAVCKTCGRKREIDQAPEDGGVVEAKSTSDAIAGGKQKTKNKALVQRGVPVTYKCPPLSDQKEQELVALGFRVVIIQ